jgi:DNA-binding Xre family transcriptional regulator
MKADLEIKQGKGRSEMATRFDRYYQKQMQNPEMRGLVEEELAALEVGIQIAQLRQSLQLNQTQLAARAGMNASKISRLETSATRNVTLGTLTRVAAALNTRVAIAFVPKEKKGAAAVRRKRR